MTMSKSLKSMNFSTANTNSYDLLPFSEAVREARCAKGKAPSSDDDMQHVLVVLTLDDNGNVVDIDAPTVSKMDEHKSTSSKKAPEKVQAVETVEVEHDENII